MLLPNTIEETYLEEEGKNTLEKLEIKMKYSMEAIKLVSFFGCLLD